MGNTKKCRIHGSHDVKKVKEFVKNTAIIVALVIIYIFLETILYRLKCL